MYCKVKEKNVKCIFYSEKISGCIGNGCKEIVSQCVGCENVVNFENKNYCNIYPEPETKWTTERCPLSTNYKKPATKRVKRKYVQNFKKK